MSGGLFLSNLFTITVVFNYRLPQRHLGIMSGGLFLSNLFTNAVVFNYRLPQRHLCIMSGGLFLSNLFTIVVAFSYRLTTTPPRFWGLLNGYSVGCYLDCFRFTHGG
jgi:hypothetical protein